jgi:threonine dehydrogenase-like Zn-dependent dehydrogenase
VAKRDEKTGTSENEALAPATVLECTGVESSVVTASYACRRAGVVVVVGVGKSIMNNLPFMHLSLAEVSFFTPLFLFFPLCTLLSCPIFFL